MSIYQMKLRMTSELMISEEVVFSMSNDEVLRTMLVHRPEYVA